MLRSAGFSVHSAWWIAIIWKGLSDALSSHVSTLLYGMFRIFFALSQEALAHLKATDCPFVFMPRATAVVAIKTLAPDWACTRTLWFSEQGVINEDQSFLLILCSSFYFLFALRCWFIGSSCWNIISTPTFDILMSRCSYIHLYCYPSFLGMSSSSSIRGSLTGGKVDSLVLVEE